MKLIPWNINNLHNFQNRQTSYMFCHSPFVRSQWMYNQFRWWLFPSMVRPTSYTHHSDRNLRKHFQTHMHDYLYARSKMDKINHKILIYWEIKSFHNNYIDGNLFFNEFFAICCWTPANRRFYVIFFCHLSNIFLCVLCLFSTLLTKKIQILNYFNTARILKI